MLFDYIRQCQRFLRDQKQDLINPEDLISYINRSRREIAMRAMCCRVLTPVSGQIISATVTAGGSGYSSAPTVTISAPDFPSGQGPKPNGDQATATAVIGGGAVTQIQINYGGYGYFQPIITLSGGGGSGATATPNLSYIAQLNLGQEVYPFSSVNLSASPGFQSVYMIKSTSIIFSNYRYSLPTYSFSTYQAMIRQYANVYKYVSFFAAQYGRGTAGSFYLFPIPSQAYQLEWDCFCLPSDLTDDTSPEAIPAPYGDAVPYFATSLAYTELQNWNIAKYFEDQFDKRMRIYGVATLPGRGINPYGRGYA